MLGVYQKGRGQDSHGRAMLTLNDGFGFQACPRPSSSPNISFLVVFANGVLGLDNASGSVQRSPCPVLTLQGLEA